jgi:iron complex outermembrane receptor protein
MPVGFALLTAGPQAHADESADTPSELREIVVIGATPVPGLGVDADKVPGNVQSLFSSDLARDGTADLTGSMNGRLGSVNINDTLADPFQPDILYRGFEASPVLGTPQGLAVYQNGVRINEAFGDSVNWDLIPDIAIDRVDIVSGSPLFGLNALGGAMSVTMKNGFTYQGVDATLSGGSFNQRAASAEAGFNQGVFGVYAAARVLNQTGWRLFAEDTVREIYMDLSLHGDGPTAELSYSRANNRLFAQGAAPVQSLALSRRNVFTGPQGNINNVDFLTLDASYEFTKAFAVQSVLYFRNYRQTVSNGDGSEFTACTGAAVAGDLCQSDAVTPLTDSNGTVIPDLTRGGAQLIGQNDFESILSQSWGGSLQVTSTAHLGSHGNSFAAGATVDTAHTNFLSGAQVGLLDSSLSVLPSPYVVDTPEGTDAPATPVMLNADSKYYGLYVTDTFDVNALLSATLSGRYNVAKLDLSDQRGTALDGNNRFTHFDPAAGVTYKVSPGVTAYAGFAINNRAPTPSEIECSDPLRPCLLPSNLSGDPPNLKQVIAHTVELGARGRLSIPSTGGHATWNAGLFRTNLDDDIYGIATTLSTGFFQNIGATRRQGFEMGFNYKDPKLTFYGTYSYIDATFLSALTINSPSNPFQDANGDIRVRRGDRLPLIPKNRIKLGADYALMPRWSVGMSLNFVDNSFYKGDESNQNPALPGYTVVALRTSYQLARQVEIFANIQNLLDKRYSTLGLYSDPTGVGAPGVPPNAASNGPGVDNRFQSPAMPRAYFGGVKVSF